MNEQRQRAQAGAPVTTACPVWCVADHEHQGAESDRWHYSVPIELPLVELARPSGHADGAMIDVALPFDVALEQPWGSPSTYVLLGVGSERQRTFCITLDSADRLIAAMRNAVDLARGTRSAG